MDTLIDQFELKETGRFRGVVNADDVLGLAKLLFPPPTLKPKPSPEQIEDSCQIIRLYASLCGRREYPRTQGGVQRDGQD